MLNLVDRAIGELLDQEWQSPPDKPEIFFSIPDESWRLRVTSGGAMRLNVYLYEVRENRNFRRSSPDDIELASGAYVVSQPPVYVDCHYLITAWSATEPTDQLEPVVDEHQVLAEAMRVLLASPEVVPSALGVPTGGKVFDNARVSLTVAPPEPARVLNDFWSTMKLPWRPAVMLIVTAPLDLLVDTPPTPIVTTFVHRFKVLDNGIVEELIQMGGLVLNASDGTPLTNAIVTRVATSQAVRTDGRGRFVFSKLQRGVHAFRASAPGMQDLQRDIDLPAGPADTHVFKLTP